MSGRIADTGLWAGGVRKRANHDHPVITGLFNKIGPKRTYVTGITELSISYRLAGNCRQRFDLDHCSPPKAGREILLVAALGRTIGLEANHG